MGREVRILVVEDSATVRRLIEFHLKKIPGVELEEAEDGLVAMEKLSSDRYDLVITDILMPRMDGLKLVNYIRSNEKLKKLPILILTTKGGDEDRKKGMELGANAYVAKPIDPREFMEAVLRLLE
ncbi:MAG: response regulator [Acidobacteria bacterium]|nr:response regulator [Acidobacteriota bacterium]